jgi:hypothetical protein
MKLFTINISLLLTFLALMFVAAPMGAQIHKIENVPVRFYGKAVDQYGNPVVDAKVTFDFVISHIAEYSTESKPMTLETDKDGRFELTGVTGYAIDKLSIIKQGYQLSKKAPNGCTFGFRPDYNADSNNPTIFRMWKLFGKEPLIGSSWHGKISEDSTTNTFDLLTGRPKEDGNLEISCLRPPSLAPDNGRFSLRFVVSIPGGGIQPTSDEFTYLAPESGYLPSFIFREDADAAVWHSEVKQEFYIKTGDGHYGRLFVECYPWQTPRGHCKWDCSINPSGSRNLER